MMHNTPQDPQTGSPHVHTNDPENGPLQAPAQAGEGALPPTLACMKQVKRWLLWRSEPNPDPTKKPRKVPYYANGNKRGETDTPEDWAQFVSYEEMCAAGSARPDFYTGAAFALGPDDHGGHWQGADADNLPVELLDDGAKRMVGYVEISPSGHGLHAIGYGRHFKPLGSNSSGVEAYASGRYFTFTGNQVKDEPIRCIADFVEKVLAPYHSRVKGAKESECYEGFEIETATPQEITDLRYALTFLPSDDRDLWQKVGHNLKTLGNVGRALWMEWSRNVLDPAQFDPLDLNGRWAGFKHTNPNNHWRAVFNKAKAAGWTNPNSNEARGIGGADEGMGGTAPSGGNLGGLGRVLQEQTMDSIVAQAIDWVWEGWIAKRYINIFAGETGAGKSTVLADIVSRITTGKRWPTEDDISKQEPRPPASVLWLGSEDGLEDMTKPRMMAAGADNSRIVVIKGVTVNGKRGTFSMQDDIETVRARLRRALDEGKPFAMLVIDPITSYLNGSVLRKVDMNDSGHIRSILEPWMAVAQEFDIAICAVTHFTKDTTRSMLHRVLGSGAFAATCRSLVAVVKPPESEDGEMLFGIHAKVMIQTKTNLPDQPDGAWIFETERIEVGTDTRNGKTIAATRAVWQEVNAMITPASYLGAKRGPVSKKAMPFGIWLQTLFLTVPLGEWLPVEVVKNKALAAGVTTLSWWKDHSAEYMEKANQNGIWMCKTRT